MKNVNTFIEVELAKSGRGIVATPDEDYLDQILVLITEPTTFY